MYEVNRSFLSHRPLFSATQKLLPQGPINRRPEDDQVSRLWVSNWGCGHAQGSPQGPETPEGLSGVTAYSFIFAKSKFALVIIDGVLGPLCLGRHKWHCPCISGSNARCERGLLKGAMSAQKAFHGSKTGTRELREKRRELLLPQTNKFLLICFPGKSMIFLPVWPP